MTTSGTVAPSSAAPRARGSRGPSGVATWLRDRLDDAARRSPARLALAVFALVVVAFTALLSLPAATASGERAPFVDALFTAASAVCVTGLTTVDTATYWSGLGQVIIMVAIKIGGLGIITLASLLGLAVSRRLGLRQRLIAASETKALRLGEVGSLLRAVVISSTAVEVTIAAVLLPSFLASGEGVGRSLYHSLFYGISSFNNAGFAVHEGGISRWVGDPFVLVPIAAGVFVGSLGFPVLLSVAGGLRRVNGVRQGRAALEPPHAPDAGDHVRRARRLGGGLRGLRVDQPPHARRSGARRPAAQRRLRGSDAARRAASPRSTSITCTSRPGRCRTCSCSSAAAVPRPRAASR